MLDTTIPLHKNFTKYFNIIKRFFASFYHLKNLTFILMSKYYKFTFSCFWLVAAASLNSADLRTLAIPSSSSASESSLKLFASNQLLRGYLK